MKPTPSTPPVQRSRLVRSLWLTLAVLFLGLAWVGVILPGMPTTVFVLLSAWAAARGSPRFHQWLLRHRLFGPMLQNWANGRSVSRNAKWAASTSMALCAVILLWVVPYRWLVAFALFSMAGVLAWLWYRPEP